MYLDWHWFQINLANCLLCRYVYFTARERRQISGSKELKKNFEKIFEKCSKSILDESVARQVDYFRTQYQPFFNTTLQLVLCRRRHHARRTAEGRALPWPRRKLLSANFLWIWVKKIPQLLCLLTATRTHSLVENRFVRCEVLQFFIILFHFGQHYIIYQKFP